MAQVPWHTDWVHAQRPFWQVLRRARWGAWRGCRGPGPPPLLSVYPGAVRKAPQQLTEHTSRPSYPSAHPGEGPASQVGGHGALQTPASPAEETPVEEACGPGPAPHGALGGRGQGAYQVLQSTLILSPGEYRSLLCIHGHASSTTQPPRPSSISPSGHTQPLMHSVWYWRAVGERGSGVRCRAQGGWPLFCCCRHPSCPDPPPSDA